MAQSYTGLINTNGEFVSLETLTGLTLTSGKTYTIQTNNRTKCKVANAEFDIFNAKPYQFIYDSEQILIKSDTFGNKLTVLENKENA